MSQNPKWNIFNNNDCTMIERSSEHTEISDIKPTNFSNFDETKFQKILIRDKRTLDEAKILYEKIKELGFFQKFYQENGFENLEEDAMLYLCRKMKYEKHKAGTFIFRENDPSNGKVYVVYSGCVLVIIKQDLNVYVKENQEIRKKIERDSKKVKTNISSSDVLPSALKVMRDPNRNSRMFTSISNVIRSSFTAEKPLNITNYLTIKKEKSQIQLNNQPTEILLNENDLMLNTITMNECESDQSIEDNTVNDLVKEAGVIKDKIYAGEIFGERALTANTLRGASILTNTDCEFLVINAEDFRIVKEIFDQTKTIKREFLLKYFPDLKNVASENIIDGYLYNLKEETYTLDSLLIEEGKYGDNLYIICEGICELSRLVIFKEKNPNEMMPLKTYKKSIPICQMGCGTFFGEEVLNDLDNVDDNIAYEYTVKVISSKVNILSIKKKVFLQRFPQECVNAVKDFYIKKKAFNEKILGDFIHNQFKDLIIDIEANDSKHNEHHLHAINNADGNSNRGVSSSTSNLMNRMSLTYIETQTSKMKKNQIGTKGAELISDEPIIVALPEKSIEIQNIKSLLNSGHTSKQKNTHFNPLSSIKAYINNIECDKNNANDIEYKNLHLKLNNRHDLKSKETPSAKSLKKILNSTKLVVQNQAETPFEKVKATKSLRKHITPGCQISSRSSLFPSPTKNKIHKKTIITDINKSNLDGSSLVTGATANSIALGSNASQREKSINHGARKQLNKILDLDILNSPALDKKIKESQGSSKHSNSIRSHANNSEDMHNYFKKLEQNFSCLGEKIQKYDEAYISNVGNFKIDLGDSTKDQEPKKSKSSANNFLQPSLVKIPQFNIEKFIKLRHERKKKRYENKFCLTSQNHLVITCNNITNTTNNNNNNTNTTITNLNNNNNNNTSILLHQEESIPSANTLTCPSKIITDEGKNFMGSKYGDIKGYLAKLKKEKNLDQTKLELNFSGFNNSALSQQIIAPLSAKSNVHYTPNSPNLILHNFNNLITPDNILKWKHQRYLSLTSRNKTTRDKLKSTDANSDYRVSTASIISFRAKLNQEYQDQSRLKCFFIYRIYFLILFLAIF